MNSTTRTGSYPIGFRRGWGDWQRDFRRLIAFAKEQQFSFLDFGPIPPEELKQVQGAGVEVGCVDLKDWKQLVSPDAGKRNAAVEANIAYVKEMTALGVRLFLTAIVPEDPARPRRENFAFAVDAYTRLTDAIAGTGARILIEGWPGQPPHFASIACTPADSRAFFEAVKSNVLGVNFDASHLVRMGIEPVRFLNEFHERVHHVHAKDTQLLPDGLYEHGHEQQATFADPRKYGGHAWRYAIPGCGHVPWAALFARLQSLGYRGRVSIELEDEQFNGTDAGEQRGLIESRDFLART